MWKVVQSYSCSNGTLEKPRILVVDDQPAGLALLKSGFGDYEVVEARNVEAALDQISKQSVDLVLLDILMGGTSGIEVCKKLKADLKTADIPVICITSREGEIDENSCWDAGCADFICKPYSMTTLTRRVQTQLALKEQTSRLRKMAFRDELTGLYNRRFFNEQFSLCQRQQIRERAPLSVLMVDIDHFKQLNDRYGHLVGDRCLQWVALILEETCRRPRDVVARFGGEEFSVLLMNTSEQGAVTVANSLMENLQRNTIPADCGEAIPQLLPEEIANITVSIGIAVREHWSALSDEDLLSHADAALYQAKKSGRNCLRIADTDIRQAVAVK